jgi:protein involved in polysaccharide export with SLBB domain
MTLNGTVWKPIGPSPILEAGTENNGLVTTIAVNPNNTNVIYLGTALGGVWRTTDGGDHWTPIFDRQPSVGFALPLGPSLGIGEPGGIAIDPNDTSVVYIGTSNRLGSAEADVVGQPTAGLFKSTDGGASWIALGSGYPASNTGNASQFVNQTINVILVDPANSQVVYLATSSGVFTSSDAGQNWTQATGLSGDTRSLALDLSTPAAARILYAGVATQGVFQSTNSGASFTQNLALATLLGASSFVRVVVALAPPTPVPNVNGIQVLYVAISGPYGDTNPVGVFISTNQGTNWTQQAAAGLSGTSYGGYAFDMAVDPASPGDGSLDTLYLGNVNQWRSTDSGANFSAKNANHNDTHTWTLVPQPAPAKSTVYVGTDGGIDVSTDGGTSYTPKNRGGLQTGLFYNIAIKPDATASVTAGALQDNKIQTTAGLGITSPEWNATTGGDGWDVAWDGSSVLYATSGGPATTVASSTNDGVNFSPITQPPWTSADTGGFVLTQLAADPSASGILYASGEQNLWQLPSGGTWRIIYTPNTSGNVDVAPTNGSHVVMAAAQGTKVYLSTNASAPTVGGASGVTFTDISPGLPSRNVSRVVFDPVDPNILYAVMNGFSGGVPQNVFRTTIGAGSWTNISPAVDVPCGAIAVDGTTTPSTLYVGTDFGVIRSIDGGASWSVLDDLRFPHVPVFDLAFNAQAGVLRAGTYGRGVWEFVQPTGPAIAVELEDDLAFGIACPGPHYLTLTVDNVGAADLVISNVERLMGSTDFTVLPTPATPLVIAPGDNIDFTVVFTPTNPGAPAEIATIRITSNDPAAPQVDLNVTGTPGAATVATAIANSGDFGNVCLGSFVDELLTINNSGTCPLLISSITGSANFLAPSVLSYPLLVDAGDSIDVVVRFQPSTHGTQSGTITIFSNDPASPHVVAVSGAAPAPKADLMIANTGDFGEVRLGRFVDRDLVVNNRGPCPLSVTSIVSSAPVVFVIPSVVSFPLAVEGGDSIAVPIRFQPTNRGSATATLTIVSNDPNSPAVVNVSGTAWPPLPIAGTALTGFPLNDNSQHVFFIGTDKYVHELDIAVGGIWADNDLTTLAGAVPPTPTSALAGFPLGPALGPNTKHVFFIGTDNHVYELYFTAGTGWVYNDLTSLARAVPPTPTSALAGHSLGDDSKHVFFIGTDNHVHELFIAGGGRWDDNDLTTLAGVGAKPPTPASALTSYRLGDDSQHVFFIGTDNHVHELFIAGAGWHDNDLTALAGAVAPAAASALTGYRLVGDDSLHVFFIGTDNHVHELFFAGGSWAANNLTALASAVPPTPTSALTGYRLGDDSQHVFFIGTDSHVHELDIAGAGWHDHDLTTLAGAVAPTPASALTGYPLGDNSKHVFFIGTDDHVHELFFAGAGWLDNDLTALT